jgi:pyrimidine-nucleoside phosphorylase
LSQDRRIDDATLVPSDTERMALLLAAHTARDRAYAPYSHFRVGAALLTSAGAIVGGCNVENISYGLTNCAERTAIFAAHAAGQLGTPHEGPRIVAIAIVADSTEPPTPCGACRQVLAEFGRDCTIICANLRGDTLTTDLGTLLPHAFGPW